MRKTLGWKRYRRELVLAILLLLTLILGFFPAVIEYYYSTGIYLIISNFLRICLGWVPFSVGDILYGTAIVFIVANIIKAVLIWLKKAFTKKRWALFFRKLLRLVMVVYLIFQWIWGLNYHRLGSSYQLSIEPGKYSVEELQELADTLNSRLTAVIPKITLKDSTEWARFDPMRDECITDYRLAARYLPFMKYRHPSVKKMLIGSIGGYGGFSGYLNPFTGEAQLNDNLPNFLRPIVTCHEIGHQLGYAAEEEANMIGYLAARQSKNPAVRYSAYHDMMTYTVRELYFTDTTAYNDYVKRLPPLVRQHSRQAADYYSSFKSPVQTLVNQWYDLYLKANSQDKGVKSYSYVVAWLIAYAKKYGWEHF